VSLFENQLIQLLGLLGPHRIAPIGAIDAKASISGGTRPTTMNIYAHMTANMEEKASHQFSKPIKGLLIIVLITIRSI
jgi:hypothetical protein